MNWKLLETAYGNAANIPALLEQLTAFPDESDYETDPWYSLWSALYHQGTVFSASFAAVPEIVKIMATAPEKVTLSFFLLPISIEIARQKDKREIDSEILPHYEQALVDLGVVATKCIAANKSSEIARVATAAFAISAGLYEYAELLIEIEPTAIEETLIWYFKR